MKKRKTDYVDSLRDILDTIEKVEQFIDGVDFDAFLKDDNDRPPLAIPAAVSVLGHAC